MRLTNDMKNRMAQEIIIDTFRDRIEKQIKRNAKAGA